MSQCHCAGECADCQRVSCDIDYIGLSPMSRQMCDGGDIMSEVMSLRKAVVYRWIRHVVTL